MRQKINRNLIAGFSISLLLLLISSIASLISINDLMDSSRMVTHTHNVIQQLDECMSTLKDAETGQRGYLLTGDEKFLQPYNVASGKVLILVNNITSLTSDNPVQVRNSAALRQAVKSRTDQLDNVMMLKKAGSPNLLTELTKGGEQMQLVRDIIQQMKDEEEHLLKTRTDRQQSLTRFTPIVIVISGLLALLITIVFYVRVRMDFNQKTRLQDELVAKDRDITRRINIIEQIATKISLGDYKVRAADTGQDGLGNLSGSLNKMAAALDDSFMQLNEKEWLQTGITGLNERMLKEQQLAPLADTIAAFVASYTNSQIAALYLAGDDRRLYLTGSYALGPKESHPALKEGEGIAGQAFKSKELIHIKNVPDDSFSLKTAVGAVKPVVLLAVPILYDDHDIGVLELAAVNDYQDKDLSFIGEIAQRIGIVINNTRNRLRIQEMLEETQAQSEELQAQHSELENMNSELEAQSQKLQASEEELRVQQEELLQANQELEERAHMLEERNETIAQRNLEIQKKAEELAMSTKYKSEFLANMSHELRTPLNSILLLSRLMSENNEQNLSDDQIEYAKVIQSSGNGLLSLIDEILDLSKIEAGKMDLEYVTLPVSEVVTDMKGLFDALAREKGLSFVIDLTPGTPAVFETDKMRLEQILKNLLSNAFKFTAQGSITLSIVSAEADQLTFSVKDTGIGIAADKQALIFEAFQQADGSTRRKYGGTGLGLSISRELARLLGGRLSLKSEPGQGAEFILELPANQIIAQKSGRSAEPVSDSLASPVIEVVAVDGPKRYHSENIPAEIPDDRHEINKGDKSILIVEDDTPFAKSLLDFTRSKGYKGIVAVRGDEGVSLAQRYQPAAILLDIQLPVKDGWEVMEALKGNVSTRHIPVHMMSSYSMRKESLQQGAVDFINKPMAFEQMQQVFTTLEHALNKEGKKVLIIEENNKHAVALSQFLASFNISSEIAGNVKDGASLLQKKEVDCVILDMGIPDKNAYETLDAVKKDPAMEDVPIIIFTGKSLSKAEEQRIRQYADSIIVKTAHSYKRMLDEVSLFLHLMEEGKKGGKSSQNYRKLGAMNDVLKDKTILVADDDVHNIFSLTRSLEQYGVNVISAVDGKEALQKLNDNPQVDLVLMDMMMPEMDGYESTRQIRKRQSTRNLPVIAVTAKTMTGDREKCIKAGASDYISKPVDVDQLLSLLRVWLYEKGN